MASKKYNLEELREIRKEWQEIPIEAIPEKYQETYKARKKAVDMYIDGETNIKIKEETAIGTSHIGNLIQKCIMSDSNGCYLGYQALIPYTKFCLAEQYKTQRSTRGKFNVLLTQYPPLKDFIIGNYLGDKKYTTEKNMNLTTLHQKFLKECLRLGVQEHEYPFNTANRGYVSLCKFIKNYKKENISKQARRESKDTMQKLHSTGIGERYTTNSIAPFQTVQVDGHIIDMEYTIEIDNIDGTKSKMIATRAWLFVVIDVATRCILGYSVSQEFNYNQYDVIDAIQDALLPRKKMDFTIKGLEYPENEGFHSLAYPELRYALFDNLMLDNAKSHLAKHTVHKVVDELKVAINFGSVATPETRGIVERFFGSLETRGFHKLPMTTGSNIKDLKRRNPEAAAIKYDITYDQMKELIEALIAQYNTTPHSALQNLTPLDSMRKKVFEAGMMPTIADKAMQKVIEELNYIVDTRRVVGGKNGKRAYINFMGTEYRSNELSLTGAYIGETITIFYNPRDISTLEAYAPDGSYIGTLKARGEFGTKSHSLKTRKIANQLARERGRQHLEFDTPITALEQHLAESGQKSRRDATKADIVKREHKDTRAQEEAKSKEEKIIELSRNTKDTRDLKYEDIKDLTPEELYQVMYGDRRR